jgi:RNA polymerase sigma factor (sigma-70 family)
MAHAIVLRTHAMSTDDSILPGLGAARTRFLELVEEIRPELHRYCARMIGSVADGEDIVQDTLARAYVELGALKELPALRAWLFRIAHNRALDLLRGSDRRMNQPLDELAEAEAADDADPDAALSREQAVEAAVSRFMELAPLQRSCVILKDVLGYPLSEIAALLELSVPAVKSSLYRGRVRLRELSGRADVEVPPQRPVSQTLERYAVLFNARDWDAVRAMLVDDVRLDMVSAETRTGRKEVGVYFTNYERLQGWRVVPGWLDGREVLAVIRHAHGAQPRYFIEVAFQDEKVTSIRDFHHVSYIGRDARFVLP